MLTSGSDQILDLVEGRVVSIPSSDRVDGLEGQVGVLHDLDGVGRVLEDRRVIVAVQHRDCDG